jgi:hypothetical protein
LDGSTLVGGAGKKEDIVGMMITTEVMIADIPPRKAGAAPSMPDMDDC